MKKRRDSLQKYSLLVVLVVWRGVGSSVRCGRRIAKYNPPKLTLIIFHMYQLDIKLINNTTCVHWE